jgi:hypothetical protein
VGNTIPHARECIEVVNLGVASEPEGNPLQFVVHPAGDIPALHGPKPRSPLVLLQSGSETKKSPGKPLFAEALGRAVEEERHPDCNPTLWQFLWED